MRLIFIRHGDPDYKNDNLTPKGKREAELLTKRICSWFSDEQSLNHAHFYSSPLGRAVATGEEAMTKLNRQAKIFPWLKEFGADRWDLMPEFYTSNKNFFNKDKWYKTRFMKSKNTESDYLEVCNGIDNLLSEYGYNRNKKGFYEVKNPVKNPIWNYDGKYQLVSQKDLYKEPYPQEETLVFFCHLGVMFTIISHLVGISPMQLWQGFYVAPTSITVLNSEERIAGQAFFRVERLGDTAHLLLGKEPISSSGYFADVLREKTDY